MALVSAKNWFAERQIQAAKLFSSLPELSFKYGREIFFVPKSVPMKLADPDLSSLKTPSDFSSEVRAHFERFPLSDKYIAWLELNQVQVLMIKKNGSCKFDGGRVVIVVGSGTQVDIHDTSVNRHSLVDLVIGEGAIVRYHSSGRHFGVQRASVAADAALTWMNVHLGGDFSYSRTSTKLVGRGASVRERSLFLGNNNDRFDLFSEAVHQAPQTSSDLLLRGALNGKAKAIQRSLIRIEPHQAACSGNEKSDTLLLGPECESDAVPMLEIESDDVKCSHGASTGKISEESLFYMMSRGMDRASALRQLVEGFFASVTGNDLSEALSKRITEIL